MKTINKETESEFYYMLQIANVLPLGTVKKWYGKGEHLLHTENNIDKLDNCFSVCEET
jgi:hypothetical protein